MTGLRLRAFSTVRLARCKSLFILVAWKRGFSEAILLGEPTRLGTGLGDWWKRQAVADQARCGRHGEVFRHSEGWLVRSPNLISCAYDASMTQMPLHFTERASSDKIMFTQTEIDALLISEP